MLTDFKLHRNYMFKETPECSVNHAVSKRVRTKSAKLSVSPEVTAT